MLTCFKLEILAHRHWDTRVVEVDHGSPHIVPNSSARLRAVRAISCSSAIPGVQPASRREKLIEKMRSTKRLVHFAERIVPQGWHISKEDPVRIPEWDEPEPDLAIVAGVPEDYRVQHPGPEDIALLADFAETTLDHDQGEKLLAYAAGGIPVYWIVNLVDRWVEVYTQPGPGGYGTRRDYVVGEEIPVVVGGVECGRVGVSDILP
jgi:hypothetical protein